MKSRFPKIVQIAIIKLTVDGEQEELNELYLDITSEYIDRYPNTNTFQIIEYIHFKLKNTFLCQNIV